MVQRSTPIAELLVEENDGLSAHDTFTEDVPVHKPLRRERPRQPPVRAVRRTKPPGVVHERYTSTVTPAPSIPEKKGVSSVAIAVLVILTALSLHALVCFVLKRMASDGVLSAQQQTVLCVLYPVATMLTLAYFGQS